MMKCNSLFLFIFTLAHGYAMAQTSQKIDEILTAYESPNPGAAVAIIKDGKIIFAKGYGLANLEEKIKVTDKTNFRLASVSKQFTAAAILQLIEQHKLSLQTRLSDCFPELPAYANSITIKHLLSHTSGILDYDDVIDENENTEQISDEGVLKASALFTKTYFVPGAQYRYSNTAYVLLGLIIKKYSGLSYPQYLAKYIFKPLKMNGSVAYVKGLNQIKNRAYGYSKKQNNWFRKDQSSTSATLGDGGIYTSLNDLFKWDAALYNNSILPQEIWQSAFQNQKLNDGSEINYGFGWHLKKNTANEKVVYHTGSTTSFRNVFYRIPSKKLSIIILTNRNTPEEMDMVQLAEKIIAAYETP
ncbi:MAG: serine hydrolase domain-containing protein [Bacteroidota bacterium]